MRTIIPGILCILLSSCAAVDWHCTKGGQWGSYYSSGDGRCTYFCADLEEKYCAATPLLAEEKQRQAQVAELQSNPRFQAWLQEQKKAQRENDIVVCKEFGFKENTDGMATCLLAQSQNRREDVIADQRAFQEANQRQLEKQQDDRARAVDAAGKIIDSNKTTTCTTTATSTGGVTRCR